ncbi:MAG: HAD family phosphatase [Nanoarchaeota archaeon]|nr:HAD family phosphatase [Nanoarchaeota archaeon]
MSRFKLVCFDVDGTLIDSVSNDFEYSWELLHNHFTIDKDVCEAVKKKFFSGSISYQEWADHDIGMWVSHGVTRQDFVSVCKKLKLMAGARETLMELKKAGCKLAIVSGSVDILLGTLMPDYKEIFDDVFFSHLTFDANDKLTGAEVTQFDMIKKADALRLIAKREGISLSECVHIGDHHNDVEIAKIAGLGIAFNCKDDELREVADVEIKKKDLREVLELIL